MWLISAIFIIGLCGLLALFIGKALELRGIKVAPLLILRRADSFIADSTRRARERLPVRLSRIGEVSFVACRSYLHRAGVALHNILEQYSARFGDYLKKHNASVLKNQNPVSSHLKNMVEYKQETIQNTDKKDSE